MTAMPQASGGHVMKKMRGRCALCRCRATNEVHGFRVCHYHVEHGESDMPCPYCHTYRLFDPRWTYTVTGEATPRKVAVRQVTLPKTIFLDANGEAVLSIVHVKEPAPSGWSTKFRPSVVMIGIGLQLGTTFSITQWASDWERELIDAARPTLALAHRIYTLNKSPITVLAGDSYTMPAPWPTMNIRDKTMSVKRLLEDQDIRPNAREQDITDEVASRYWRRVDISGREDVWRHNYMDVLDLSMRIFQIEWEQNDGIQADS